MDTEPNTPLYYSIQREIERQIISGAWPPGHRIPSEAELLEQFNCSRMTVNKAMSNLAATGMIIRRRRYGTFVAQPRHQVSLNRVQDIGADTMASGRAYRYKMLRRVVRVADSIEDAEHVGVPINTRILTLEVLHFADDERLALETRQINLTAAPAAEDEPFKDVPPGAWLLANIPWTEGETSVRALPADRNSSQRLKIPIGSACLSVARRTWNSGVLITFGRLVYPGERHRFISRFTPASTAL